MRTGVTAAGVISLVAGAALAQSIVGTGVPAGTGWFIPAGLSADGAVMVGNASNGHGYRWTEAGGFEDMGLPAGGGTVLVSGVSAEGGFVAGRTYQPGVSFRAFRWTPSGGYQSLGVLGGGTFSYGYAISTDGAVVVGQGSDGSSIYKATRWTTALGLRAIPLGTGVISDCTAWGTNSDGSVVVGQTFVGGAPAGYRAFRWAGSGMELLIPAPGHAHSKAFAVNGSGSVVYGVSSVTWDSAQHLMRWTAGVPVDLGMIDGGTEAQPSCISEAGDAVGLILRVQGDPRAGVYTDATGIRNLNELLPALGVDLTGWTLTRTYGMSADGRTIVGEAGSQSWMVRLPCLGAPSVIDPPDPRAVCDGGSADFAVVAGGAGIGSYVWSWRPEGAPAGGWMDVIAGANSDPSGDGLAFDATNVGAARVDLAGITGPAGSVFFVRCEITNPCGSTTTVGARVSVCISDFNCDAGVDGDDVIDYFGAWDRNDATADVNRDGGVDSDDVIVFFSRWDGGC